MNKIVMTIIISILMLGCNSKAVNKWADNNYHTSKKKYDSLLVNHFPLKLPQHPNNVIDNNNISKNDVAFMLYEYNVSTSTIDSVLSKISGKFIDKYNAKDSCLLIVNRFETIESNANMGEVKISDSTLINKECYKSIYPIPNFIAYNYPATGDLKLDESFDIFVLEAKKGNHFSAFELLPNPQMPIDWGNGYSKGIAISKKKRTLIYWAIIW